MMQYMTFLSHLLLMSLFTVQEDTLKLLFIGDIMQHQAQLDAALVKGSEKKGTRVFDYSSYFAQLKDHFNRADLTIANMETTFAGPPYSGYPNFNSPHALLTACVESGIDIFLAANNHTCDKGRRGLLGTIGLYDSLGILYTGIYRNPEEEAKRNPLIVNIRGFKVAFLNYTYGTNGIPIPAPFVVKILDTSAIKTDIARAKALNPDFIIVCPHWDEEYKLVHSARQERMERFFYANGADLIIGSHPHVVQDYNIIMADSTSIAHITIYSLGNAISNMTAPNTRVGMMAGITLCKGENGSKRILEPKIEYIWTSRPKMFERNFSIIPIQDKEKYLRQKR